MRRWGRHSFRNIIWRRDDVVQTPTDDSRWNRPDSDICNNIFQIVTMSFKALIAKPHSDNNSSDDAESVEMNCERTEFQYRGSRCWNRSVQSFTCPLQLVQMLLDQSNHLNQFRMSLCEFLFHSRKLLALNSHLILRQMQQRYLPNRCNQG